MLVLRFIYWLLWSVLVLADVEITSPASKDSVKASSGKVALTVKWKDDGSSPDLKGVSSYSFTLCTGPNTNIQGVDTVDTVTPAKAADDSYDLSFDASSYGSGYFYVQIYTTFSSGGYSIHYSDRFKVSGLTGSKDATGSGEHPNAEESMPASAADSASFTVTYTKQTGPTRYAPMQMQPGSTVTVTTWSQRFPTSAVTYYSTYRKTLDQVSTITPGWSYTKTSLVNAATPAPFPSEVGWYAPSTRLESATREGTHRIKKRRWDD